MQYINLHTYISFPAPPRPTARCASAPRSSQRRSNCYYYYYYYIVFLILKDDFQGVDFWCAIFLPPEARNAEAVQEICLEILKLES